MRTITAVVLGLGLMPLPARALTQGEHRHVTRAACQEAGMPAVFCERVAAAAHDVDALEPDDPAAHAWRGEGQTPCQAAAAAESRLWSLGSRIRDRAERLARARDRHLMGDLADRLGQALHTLQDACVHAGSTAADHAASLLSLACGASAAAGAQDPPGTACPSGETRAAFDALATLLDRLGLSGTVLFEVGEARIHWPRRARLCADLRAAGQRVVRTRDRMLAVTRLRDPLARALLGSPVAPRSDCTPEPVQLDPPDVVDLAGPTWCDAVERYCSDPDGGPPPWERAVTPEEPGGCATGHGPGGAWLLILALGLARRRRARPEPDRLGRRTRYEP